MTSLMAAFSVETKWSGSTSGDVDMLLRMSLRWGEGRSVAMQPFFETEEKSFFFLANFLKTIRPYLGEALHQRVSQGKLWKLKGGIRKHPDSASYTSYRSLEPSRLKEQRAWRKISSGKKEPPPRSNPTNIGDLSDTSEVLPRYFEVKLSL